MIARVPSFPARRITNRRHHDDSANAALTLDPEGYHGAAVLGFAHAVRSRHGKIAFAGESAEALNNNDLIREFYLGA